MRINNKVRIVCLDCKEIAFKQWNVKLADCPIICNNFMFSYYSFSANNATFWENYCRLYSVDPVICQLAERCAYYMIPLLQNKVVGTFIQCAVVPWRHSAHSGAWSTKTVYCEGLKWDQKALLFFELGLVPRNPCADFLASMAIN